MSFQSTPLPYLTANLPGIGGRLKEVPEDFIVEEIPAYEPSGSGEHLFLWVEKRDLPHDVMLRRISKTLDVSSNDIGTAGIKDRRAITRQYLSVPVRCAPQVSQLDSHELRILRAVPHGNKLRTGHVRGNRFTILVRDTVDAAEARSQLISQSIRQQRFPNYYGEQRFGFDGQTLTLGLDLLSKKASPRDIPFQKRKFLLRLALSSVQSYLFNQCLARRLNDGLLQTVLEGDVMEVTESGGKFAVDDVEQEQIRLNSGEISVTGPMFGVKMMTPVGLAGERECQLLAESRLTLADFANFSQLLSGARRSYLARPGDFQLKATELGIQFEFSLPSGTYATMLLREFMKADGINEPDTNEKALLPEGEGLIE